MRQSSVKWTNIFVIFWLPPGRKGFRAHCCSLHYMVAAGEGCQFVGREVRKKQFWLSKWMWVPIPGLLSSTLAPFPTLFLVFLVSVRPCLSLPRSPFSRILSLVWLLCAAACDRQKVDITIVNDDGDAVDEGGHPKIVFGKRPSKITRAMLPKKYRHLLSLLKAKPFGNRTKISH